MRSFPLDGNSYPTRHNANKNIAVILCYIFYFVQIVSLFFEFECVLIFILCMACQWMCVWRRGSRYPFAAKRQLFSFKLKSLYKCIKSLSVRMEKRTYQRKINWFVYVAFLSIVKCQTTEFNIKVITDMYKDRWLLTVFVEVLPFQFCTTSHMLRFTE